MYGYTATTVIVTAIRSEKVNDSTSIHQGQKREALQDLGSRVGGISVAPALARLLLKDTLRGPGIIPIFGSAPRASRPLYKGVRYLGTAMSWVPMLHQGFRC